MNKRLLVVGLSLAVIGISSLAFISKPTYQEVSMNNLESENIALYIKNDTGNYEKTNTIPTSGYILNEEKSRCNNNAKPSWNKATNSLKIKDLSNDNTSCYLYFDKQEGLTSQDIIAANNPKTTAPDFSQVATTDEGVYAVEDGMYGGTSYYWRGAATTNYVKFANFCWRIVRINGDGSIRLIYDGITCHENGTTGEVAVASQVYNASRDRSEYVGYTYTSESQRPGDNATGTASNLKTQTENWYKTNITDKGYDGKVAESKFCNDREAVSGYTWSSQPSSTFYYAGYDRSGAKSSTSVKPTLDCSKETGKNDIYNLKAGAITMDEVIMAGAKLATGNSSYYLYNGQYYWTMSPYRLYWNGSYRYAHVFYVYSDGQLANDVVSNAFGVRPVINLRSDIQIKPGTNGTLDNPYVVEGE